MHLSLESRCDKNGIIYEKYGVSKSKDEFLLSSGGIIIDAGKLSDLDGFLKKAELISLEIQAECESMYGG